MAVETNPSTPIVATPSSPSGQIGVSSESPAAAASFASKYNTQGWWMFFGITTAILLGNTPIAPFAFGILTVALIYQVGLLLEHK